MVIEHVHTSFQDKKNKKTFFHVFILYRGLVDIQKCHIFSEMFELKKM